MPFRKICSIIDMLNCTLHSKVQRKRNNFLWRCCVKPPENFDGGMQNEGSVCVQTRWKNPVGNHEGGSYCGVHG